MPRIYTKPFTVPADAIDVHGQVNNQEYLRWMQDIAIEHSVAQGWPVERYFQSGGSWYIRSHYIEYFQPGFAGDSLSISTWVAGMAERSSPRRYLFVRDSDRRVLARAETLWTFIDLRTGRGCSVPEAVSSAFEVIPDEAEVLSALGLRAIQ